MTAIFTQKEMETCIVTGKRIKEEDKMKQLLEQDKVLAIIGKVEFTKNKNNITNTVYFENQCNSTAQKEPHNAPHVL